MQLTAATDYHYRHYYDKLLASVPVYVCYVHVLTMHIKRSKTLPSMHKHVTMAIQSSAWSLHGVYMYMYNVVYLNNNRSCTITFCMYIYIYNYTCTSSCFCGIISRNVVSVRCDSKMK